MWFYKDVISAGPFRLEILYKNVYDKTFLLEKPQCKDIPDKIRGRVQEMVSHLKSVTLIVPKGAGRGYVVVAK